MLKNCTLGSHDDQSTVQLVRCAERWGVWGENLCGPLKTRAMQSDGRGESIAQKQNPSTKLLGMPDGMPEFFNGKKPSIHAGCSLISGGEGVNSRLG